MRIPVTRAQAKWADDAARRGNMLKADLKTGQIREVRKRRRKKWKE